MGIPIIISVHFTSLTYSAGLQYISAPKAILYAKIIFFLNAFFSSFLFGLGPLSSFHYFVSFIALSRLCLPLIFTQFGKKHKKHFMHKCTHSLLSGIVNKWHLINGDFTYTYTFPTWIFFYIYIFFVLLYITLPPIITFFCLFPLIFLFTCLSGSIQLSLMIFFPLTIK